MRNMTETELTEVVLERYASTPDARLCTVLNSLIRHLHAFVRDVRLTEAEWIAGIEFLTRTGQISDNKRQEMILLSDNLGVSALVNMLSAGVEEGATESTVLGPFYVPGSPERQWGESVLLREGDDTPLVIHGRVTDANGEPVPDATIEIWQTDANGMYDIQDTSQPEDNLRGWYRARPDGAFLMKTIRPTSYPIPTDGPVGELLRATARHPFRPAHLHAIVSAPGFRKLTTHLFDAEDTYLDSDVVFAVKSSLIREFRRNDSPDAAEQFGVRGPFWELANDFVLTRLG
ncbi:intradiol ring-cleavage dioxygenase [Paraburkholderia saeva]|uniref:intradiol ring-cleavage dioxygenase n=1 Tax=Paraburkholderia saeva TaxID=2777537 RepID=UPI001DFF140E|nr:intradiol ring-cleavage dioxygenase [Paraburkholderia saeva]CAG4889854.1 Hydroxyquinol 1,2-dioxygenase [Paraburkholderia saeva]CAG4897333.1 Hydroxyquinol 1,2-dioxygenase [Paraburkholderia saeva]